MSDRSPPASLERSSHAGRALLLWGSAEAEVEALRDLLGEDPMLLLANLDDQGGIPAQLPTLDQAVILADWARLAGDLSIVDRWREALFPAPVGVLVRIERPRFDEALLQVSAREVDDFVEAPCHPGYLTRKVLTTFRYLTAQQGTQGLRAELVEQTADFKEFHRVALALAAEGNVERLLELIVQKCREATAADAGSLYLLEGTPGETPPGAEGPRETLRFVVAQNDSRRLDLRKVSLPLNRATIAGFVALTRTVINLPDVYRLPANLAFTFNPAMDQRLGYRTISMLAIPMIDQTDRVIGVVQVINKKRSPDIRLDSPETAMANVLPFDSRDQEMVQSLASLASVVTVQGRRAAEARVALDRQLRQVDRMEAVGRLAGGAAHDFNNLLTVITGRCAFLLDQMGTHEPLRRHVELIEETARKATELSAQLQAFSRGQLLQPRLLSTKEVVRAMVPGLQRRLGPRIELDLVEGPGLGLTEADPRQIEQAITNLAVNAQEAMPQGGRLTIETRDVDLDESFVRGHAGARPGPYVAIVVRDTGAGLPEPIQAHVFEPLFTTKGAALGLGLATVYAIVRQHEGLVTVESEVGRGAAVTIYLPRADAVEPPAEAPAATPVPAPAGAPTILVVEDEDPVRDLVCEVLGAAGYSVLAARNGPEALVTAKGHPGRLDLLLTDVVMPEMSGPGLAEWVIPHHPGIRVLYMSGYAADALDSGGLETGRTLLLKPFSPQGLVEAVRRVLAGPPADADAGSGLDRGASPGASV